MYTGRTKPISKKISILLSIVMVMTMMPMGTFAVGYSSDQQIGPYHEVNQSNGVALGDAALAEGDTEVVEQMVKQGGEKTDALWMDKTIEGTDQENVFDITLTVKTKEDLDRLSKVPDAAVILLMDVSSSMKYNMSGTKTNNVPAADQRITKARMGAKDFLDAFSANSGDGERWISVVKFGSNAETVGSWVNVAEPGNVNVAKGYIDGIIIGDGIGTNMEGGLQLAHNVMESFKSSRPQISNVYIIMLSDGVPTWHIASDANRSSTTYIKGVRGGGTSASKNDYEPVYKKSGSTETGISVRIKEAGTTLYSIAYAMNNAGTVAGKDAKAWMRDFSNRVFEAGDDIGLVFRSIAEIIRMSIEAWSVTDPFPEYMIFESSDPVNLASQISVGGSSFRRYEAAEHQLVWDLKSDTPVKSGDIFTYILKYRLRLNTAHASIQEGVFYPANEPTSLKYFFKEEVLDQDGNIVNGSDEERTSYFNIPTVKGLFGNFAFDKVVYHNDNALEGAIFHLTDNANASHVIAAISNSAGKVNFTRIPSGDYTMTEESAPATYELNGDSYNIEVAWGSVTIKDKDGKTVNPVNFKYKNKLKQIPINIKVTKNWLVPQSSVVPIKINLVQKSSSDDAGTIVATKVLRSEPWEYTFSGIDKINQESGLDWIYEVTETDEEDNAFDNFTTTITGDKNNGFTITNLIKQQKVSVTAKKVWQTYEGDTPPAVTVTLFKNGIATASTKQLTANNNWVAIFDNLAMYDDQGQEISYSIQETVPAGYSKISAITEGNKTTFTNKIDNEKIEIKGVKTWVDPDKTGDRPAVTIELWRDGLKIAERTSTIAESAEESWAYKFSSSDDLVLWKYKQNSDGSYILDGNGNVRQYDYRIKEVGLNGYISVLDGYNVKNTIAGKTVVSGNKVWIDLPEFNGVHPPITINLLRNGSKIDSRTLGSGITEFEFPNLDKYDGNGKKYVYTISEDPVEGYSGHCNQETYTVTNTALMDDTVSLCGQKVWRQPSDMDKPAITVYLLQDGKRMSGKSISFPANAEDYNFCFNDLPKYYIAEVGDDEGEEPIEQIVPYEYTVEEIAVPGYITSYGSNTIINTIKGKTQVRGNKVWKDPAGTLHDDVTIELWRKVENSSDDSWINTGKSELITDADRSFTFANLDLYNNEGERYEYTVREVGINGYSTDIVKDGNGNFVVTNTMNPQYKTLAGVKTWIDPDGTRHGDITVRLMQNNVEVARVMLADGETSYTFINTAEGTNGQWPVYDENQNKYHYSVIEDPVPGYDTRYNGLDVINTIKQDDSLSYKVEKLWIAPAGMEYPPIEITLWMTDSKGVKIEAGNKILEDGTVEYTFLNLNKYDAYGKPYSYSVTEKPVPGYTTSVDGRIVKNTIDQDWISVTVNKIWNDGNGETGPVRSMTTFNVDGPISGTRDKVIFQLLADGRPVEGQIIEVTSEGGWSGTFHKLPRYTEETRARIVYGVKEIEVPGYSVEIEGSTEDDDGNLTFNVVNTAKDYYYMVWRHYTTITNGVPGAPQTVQGELIKGSYNQFILQEDVAEDGYLQYESKNYTFRSDKGESSIQLINAGLENAAIINLYYERTATTGGGGGGDPVYKYQVIRHYGNIDTEGNVSYTDKVEENVVTLNKAERNALTDHKITVDGNKFTYLNYKGKEYEYRDFDSIDSVVLEKTNTIYKLNLYYVLGIAVIPDEEPPLGPGEENDGVITIPDSEPPLGPAPGGIVIPDKKAPLDMAPKTGDPGKSNLLHAYLIALVLAGLGAAASAWGLGRRREGQVE